MVDTAYKITALDDFTESINMLVYADPGAGKTVFGGTAQSALLIATEPGSISAKRMGSKAKLAQIESWGAFATLLRDLRAGKFDGKAKWLVVDTLTALQQLVLTGILEDRPDSMRAKMPDEVPAMQDYMVWQRRFQSVVNALNDLPMNVLYLCHTMTDEDEDGNRVILPSLTGKNGTPDQTQMSRWVCGTVHLYGYLAVKTTDEGQESRRLVARRVGPYFGKDRYNALPNGRLSEPTVPKIEKLILDTATTKE